MKIINQFLITLFLSILSLNTFATNYKYNADVDGMVCAFCAYSVGKNISKLPGINADSINVDLKGGHVIFESDKKVSEKKLSEIFKDSGFSLSNISFTTIHNPKNKVASEVVLDLKIDAFKTDQFSAVIEALGNKVANTQSSLIIHAPASQEETILKPLLMGRQQVVKVQFIESDADMVNIQLMSY